MNFTRRSCLQAICRGLAAGVVTGSANRVTLAARSVSKADHIGWDVIDAKRESVGMKKLVEALPDKDSSFVHRQPEHVEIAGALGRGVWDRRKIDLRKVQV
jgi:hypothetical protein